MNWQQEENEALRRELRNLQGEVQKLNAQKQALRHRLLDAGLWTELDEQQYR